MTAVEDDGYLDALVSDEPVAVAPCAGEVHTGQVRMAYRLAAAYSGRLMHVHSLGWYVWDEVRWRADDQGAAKRAVIDVLRTAHHEGFGDKDLLRDVTRCESAAGVAGVLDLASALQPFAFTVEHLDADPYLLNTPTGTVDLRDGILRKHDPADRITKLTRAGYRPGAASAVWDGFLQRVLPDEPVRGFLQRLAGLGTCGKVLEHVLGILTGSGANGKGTFYGALSYALGDYALSAEPDLFMHREGAHPTGEMDLRGVRWCVVSESDRDRRLAEATMKRLTGGDRIRARRMRQDFVEFAPSHTPILVTNHLPKVSGDDPAIWRRLRVVPFSVEIPEHERDSHLGERLELDADAILAWAVAGYRSYDQIGMAEPDAVKAATNDYQRASDALARFIAEACYLAPAAYATTGQLFERWSAWAVQDGAEPMSSKKFGQALDQRGYPAGPGGRAGRRRKGIGLLADEGEDDQ